MTDRERAEGKDAQKEESWTGNRKGGTRGAICRAGREEACDGAVALGALARDDETPQRLSAPRAGRSILVESCSRLHKASVGGAENAKGDALRSVRSRG